MRTIPAILAACSLALGTGAAAQTEGGRDGARERPPVGENPLLTDTSADQLLRERISRPAGGIAILPAQPPSVGQVEPNQPLDATRLDLADGSSEWTERGTLRPEGTFLIGWTGEVVRLRTGGLAFLPVTEEGSGPEPAMALLPCAVNGRIRTLVGEEQRGLWLSLTGEVLEYHGRNYLLPTAFASAEAPPEPAEADQDGEVQPAVEPENRVDELVRQLEAERAERRGIDTAFGAEHGEEASPEARVDGRMLLSQRARMVRSADGGWVVAIDNDGESAGLVLPHRLRLLPCRVVTQMERLAESRGEGWSFEVSGHLYRQGATVYLLPRMFVTLAGEDVEPLQ